MVTNCDGFDPNPPRDGYREHGTYVGGIGWDLMCGPCEMGEPAMPELSEHELAAQRLDDALVLVGEFDNFVTVVASHCKPSDHGRVSAAVLDYFDHDHRYQWAATVLATVASTPRTEREQTS